jgi:hypothetical protein
VGVPPSEHARRWAAIVALVVFTGVAAIGVLTHREPHLAVPVAKAERLAARDPRIADVVRGATRFSVLHVDDDLEKVTWFRGSRIVATAGVRRDGSVFQAIPFTTGRIGYGAPLSHEPLVLALLTVLFLLATLRRSLRSRRSVHVALIAAFVIPAVLVDRARMGLGEVVAATLLAALVVAGTDAAWRRPHALDDAPAPSLLDHVANRWRLPKLAWQIAAGLLTATLLTTVTSTGVVDVAEANMEGATLLLHGVLPYGHMPGDVVHGDTYGLPIYALYAPLAAIWPMHTTWDDATGSLLVGALTVLVLALGLERATRGSRWVTVIAALALPAALMSFSSGTNDILVAAALVWAFAWFARPAASSALLAGAGLAKVAPLVLLPIWLARLRGRELRRAVWACAAVGAAVLGGLVALGGVHGPLDMVHAMAFQLDRRSEMSVWTVLDARTLQPVVQAVVLAVALGGAVLVALDRSVATDPRRVAGLVTAVLAGLQLSANHWMPLYLLWLLPPAMIALLGPLGATASARAPVEVAPVGHLRSEGAGEPALWAA